MKPITKKQISEWNKNFDSDPQRRLAERALSKANLNDVAFVPAGSNLMRHKFSVEIKTLEAANQKSSGRCWLFAATNVLREMIAKKCNIEKFELSQSYLAFYDKFERSNYFFESIIETADLPTDDRTVAHILNTGVHDGGQWDMFANIVRKYGIIPKDSFDDTFQSNNTSAMNRILNQNLKAGAVKLRRMIAEKATDEQVTEEKNRMLAKIYSFLCSCYGKPPEKFDFEYVDKDSVYHIEKGYTPKSFAEKYIGNLLDNVVSIINAPTADKPYHQTFTIRLLGNVVGGKKVVHLNLKLDEFKKAVISQLKAGKVVWFGSDVSYYGDRSLGVWDDRSFDYELLSGLDLDISKADALDYDFSAMNHAMVLTGVNLDGDKPTRWKIENSWGDKGGEKGYYICSDSWFDRFVYQAAVEKEYLGDLKKFAGKEPIELEPWDPMGTLAD